MLDERLSLGYVLYKQMRADYSQCSSPSLGVGNGLQIFKHSLDYSVHDSFVPQIHRTNQTNLLFDIPDTE